MPGYANPAIHKNPTTQDYEWWLPLPYSRHSLQDRPDSKNEITILRQGHHTRWFSRTHTKSDMHPHRSTEHVSTNAQNDQTCMKISSWSVITSLTHIRPFQRPCHFCSPSFRMLKFTSIMFLSTPQCTIWPNAGKQLFDSTADPPILGPRNSWAFSWLSRPGWGPPTFRTPQHATTNCPPHDNANANASSMQTFTLF